MSYFVLRYDAVVDDYVNRRAPYRAEHLKLLSEAHARGEVVMAGAVGESPDGAIIIFRSATPELAEQFVRNDPYVQNGLILTWRVQPWNVVIGAQD
ncbi:MAG TPA: YciI-like protein [Vicinamibacterales bacterium]|nr:YciI-like protein [Vicinamibacterales bacterium]